MAKKAKSFFTLKDLRKKGIKISNSNGLDIPPLSQSKQGKIRNAKKTVFNGVQYDSKLEAKFASTALMLGLPFTHHHQPYTLMEGFVYEGKKYQPTTYTPDFEGNGWIVEVKGYANDTWPLKKKMFLKHLRDNNIKVDFRVLKDSNEIESFINEKVNNAQNKTLTT
jgi:hypothetical protein